MTEKNAIKKNSDYDSSLQLDSHSRASSFSNGNYEGNKKIGFMDRTMATASSCTLNDEYLRSSRISIPNQKERELPPDYSILKSDEGNLFENSSESTQSNKDIRRNISDSISHTSPSNSNSLESQTKKSYFNPNAQEFFPKINSKHGFSQPPSLTKFSNQKKMTSTTFIVSHAPKEPPTTPPMNKFVNKSISKKPPTLIYGSYGNTTFNANKVPVSTSNTQHSSYNLNTNYLGIFPNTSSQTSVHITPQFKNNNGNNLHNSSEPKLNPNNLQNKIPSAMNQLNLLGTSPYQAITNSSFSVHPQSKNVNGPQTIPLTSTNTSTFDLMQGQTFNSTNIIPSSYQLNTNENLNIQNQTLSNLANLSLSKSTSIPSPISKNSNTNLLSNNLKQKKKLQPTAYNFNENKQISNKNMSYSPVEENPNLPQDSLQYVSLGNINKDNLHMSYNSFDFSDKIGEAQPEFNSGKTIEESDLHLSKTLFISNEKESNISTQNSEGNPTMLSTPTDIPTSTPLTSSTSSLINNNPTIRHISCTWEKVLLPSRSDFPFQIIENSNFFYCLTYWNSPRKHVQIFSYSNTNGNNIWTKLHVNGISPIHQHEITFLSGKGKIYSFESYPYGFDFFSLLEFDLDTRLWSICSIQPNSELLARQDFSLTFLDDSIYLFGGFLYNNIEGRNVFFLNDFWKLKLKENSWQQLNDNSNNDPSKSESQIPQARAGHSSIAYQHSIYIFGGTINECEFNDLYKFDTLTKSWSQILGSGAVPSPRYCHSVSTYEDKMMIFGGFGLQSGFLSDLHEFNFSTHLWTKIFIKESNLKPSGRFRHFSAISEGSLFIFGGKRFLDSYEKSSESENILELSDCFKISILNPEGDLTTLKSSNFKGKYKASYQNDQQNPNLPENSLSSPKQQNPTSPQIPKQNNIPIDNFSRLLEEFTSLIYQRQALINEITKKDILIKELTNNLHNTNKTLDQFSLAFKHLSIVLQSLKTDNHNLKLKFERIVPDNMSLIENKQIDSSLKGEYFEFSSSNDSISQNTFKTNPPISQASNNKHPLYSFQSNLNKIDNLSYFENLSSSRFSKPLNPNNWPFSSDSYKPLTPLIANSNTFFSSSYQNTASHTSAISTSNNETSSLHTPTNSLTPTPPQIQPASHSYSSTLTSPDTFDQNFPSNITTNTKSNTITPELIQYLLTSHNDSKLNLSNSPQTYFHHYDTSSNLQSRSNLFKNNKSQSPWDGDSMNLLPSVNKQRNWILKNQVLSNKEITSNNTNTNLSLESPSPELQDCNSSNFSKIFPSTQVSTGSFNETYTSKIISTPNKTEHHITKSPNEKRENLPLWNNQFTQTEPNSCTPPIPREDLLSLEVSLSQPIFSKSLISTDIPGTHGIAQNPNDYSTQEFNFRLNQRLQQENSQRTLEMPTESTFKQLSNQFHSHNDQLSTAFPLNLSENQYNTAPILNTKLSFPGTHQYFTDNVSSILGNLNSTPIQQTSSINLFKSENFNPKATDESYSNQSKSFSLNKSFFESNLTQNFLEDHKWNFKLNHPDDQEKKKYDWA